MSKYQIYGNHLSGNCLKVKWLCELRGLAYDWHEVDSIKGETQLAEFAERFPMRQVPVLVLDDGRHITQSNGIMRYLAHGSDLISDDPFEIAKIDEWLFWEQYSHEPYIAVCRAQMRFRGVAKADRELWRVENGEKALDLMQSHLASHDYFAANKFTIADIALYAYTNVADEGGFDLGQRPAITAWIKRCQHQLNLSAAS